MDSDPGQYVMTQAGRRRYRVVAATLRDRDVAEADRIAEALRGAGWYYSNRSFVIRAALVCLSDALHGKSPAEILRYFIDRRSRRPQPTVTPG